MHQPLCEKRYDDHAENDECEAADDLRIDSIEGAHGFGIEQPHPIDPSNHPLSRGRWVAPPSLGLAHRPEINATLVESRRLSTLN